MNTFNTYSTRYFNSLLDYVQVVDYTRLWCNDFIAYLHCTFKNTNTLPQWTEFAEIPIDTVRESMALTSDGYTVFVNSEHNKHLSVIGEIPPGTHMFDLVIPRK